MSGITDFDPEEGGEEEEVAEGEAKIEAEPVGTKEAPKSTIDAEATEIAEAIIRTFEVDPAPILEDSAMGPME